MPTTPEGFSRRLLRLKADLIEQGRRVQSLIEAAFEAAFSRDADAARDVINRDEVIDRVDVDIERAAVALLTDVSVAPCELGDGQMRMLLTIVKVNNELERIADRGVSIAEEVRLLSAVDSPIPPTFHVLGNSIAGICRDAIAALDRLDPDLAQVVLSSEDAVEQFKKALLRDAQQSVAKGAMSVDFAIALTEIATFSEIMADHCTNIAEQVLYASSGRIFRHKEGHWEEMSLPPNC